MANKDAVLLKFQPPVYGEHLYHFVKRAAEKTGYTVRDEEPNNHDLSRIIYSLVQEDELVWISARNVRKLTLDSRGEVGGRTDYVPSSHLEFEIDLNEQYSAIPCKYHPMDQNEFVEKGGLRDIDKSSRDNPTPLHQFVVALQQERKKGI